MTTNTTVASTVQAQIPAGTGTQSGPLNADNDLPAPTGTIILSRLLAGASGTAILAASTWAVIDAGQLTGSSAALPITLAAGVAVGAAVLSRMPTRRMAGAMIAALIAGELSGLIAVAERVVVQREATASVRTSDNGKSTGANQRLTKAERELSEHRTAAIAAVAQKGCAAECRQLLENQGRELSDEVVSARSFHHAASRLCNALG
jgi:hypothetical protein